MNSTKIQFNQFPVIIYMISVLALLEDIERFYREQNDLLSYAMLTSLQKKKAYKMKLVMCGNSLSVEINAERRERSIFISYNVLNISHTGETALCFRNGMYAVCAAL